MKISLMDHEKIRRIIADALVGEDLDGKRVLVLTPDGTRSGPTAMIVKTLADLLLPRVKQLGFLIALGTHQPLSDEAINQLYGLSPEDRAGKYSGIEIKNHRWERPDTFKRIGTIPAAEIEELSEGRMHEEAPVALNKLIFDFDHVIIYGPVFPHEVAGFSGGHKYFFPGIAGADIINLTHWLGALITSFEIIGRAGNPVRELIERAAGMIEAPVTGLMGVTEGGHGLAGLFAGPVRESWERACELSARAHIQWVQRPYKLVVSEMPKMYNDLWVGAKGMYKVEPVIEDGGEVIIYAPHIKEVSYTHGELLHRIGYHVRDYFTAQWDQFKEFPGGVLAHSTHLKGIGEYKNGVERPRIKVTLATGIPEERCHRLSLGYKDPAKINPAECEGREDEGVLVVRRAGEELYRLESQRPAGSGAGGEGSSG